MCVLPTTLFPCYIEMATLQDHYINVPIDLSQVLFICTSNSLDTISLPLLDRCEIIHLSGYTYSEKLHIAQRYLLPKQLSLNGLDTRNLDMSEETMMRVMIGYTREAGVRGLDRALGAVVRFKAVERQERVDEGKEGEYVPRVVVEDLVKILGVERWEEQEGGEREERRGVVYGLVVTGQGEGGVLPVETLAVPGTGTLKLTGSLGEVRQASP